MRLSGRYAELQDAIVDVPIQRLNEEVNYMVERIVAGADEHGSENVDTTALKLITELRQEIVDSCFYLREMQALLMPKEGKPHRIYLCGCYSNEERHIVDENITLARKATAVLLYSGHYVFTPHLMTANFDVLYPEIKYEQYLEMYSHWLRLCHGIFLLPRWDESNGARLEAELARRGNLKIFRSMSEIPSVEGFQTAVECAKILGYTDDFVI